MARTVYILHLMLAVNIFLSTNLPPPPPTPPPFYSLSTLIIIRSFFHLQSKHDEKNVCYNLSVFLLWFPRIISFTYEDSRSWQGLLGQVLYHWPHCLLLQYIAVFLQCTTVTCSTLQCSLVQYSEAHSGVELCIQSHPWQELRW